ncbi:uncharacterized protein LOC116249998 [Nymphaea colorata]|nr:uncharacterized protein LOC116249998 [Nymphaea colorata]
MYLIAFLHYCKCLAVYKLDITGFTDETPRDYYCNLGPDCRRRDADERPELCRGTDEFVASKEYMVRDPMPAVFFFLVDVSMNAIQSGATAAACSAVAQSINDLPESPRNMVGFATYDSTVPLPVALLFVPFPKPCSGRHQLQRRGLRPSQPGEKPQALLDKCKGGCIQWRSWSTSQSFDRHALELLERMPTLDPSQRISAKMHLMLSVSSVIRCHVARKEQEEKTTAKAARRNSQEAKITASSTTSMFAANSAARATAYANQA